MASWGALSGLGAGLQQFGNEWSDRAKQKLASDLQKQREERAAERELAREQRQEAARLRQVDPRNTEIDVDPTTGRMFRQLRNSEYQPLDRVEVGASEQESIRRQEEAENAKLRSQGLEATLKELQVARLPEKYAQEDAMHRARLGTEGARQGSLNASARASDRRGLESAVTEQGRNSATDAQTLIRSYDALVKDYTTGTKDNPAKLSRAEVEELAFAAVRRSAQRGDRPESVAARFREMLRAEAAKKETTPSGRPRTGSLLGN